jgi:hypothetical protein
MPGKNEGGFYAEAVNAGVFRADAGHRNGLNALALTQRETIHQASKILRN